MLPLIGIAAMLGGMAMKGIAAKKATKTAAKYAQKQRDRNQRYQHEAQARLSDVLGTMDRESVDAAMKTAAADRFAAIQGGAGVDPEADTYIEGRSSAPRVVKEAAAKSLSQALAAGKERSRLMGEMGAFGDFTTGMGRSLGRSREDISRLARMARASGEILPMELQAAKNAGQGWRVAGDISSGVGQMMLGGGMMAPAGGAGGFGLGSYMNTLAGGLGTTPGSQQSRMLAGQVR